MQDPDDAEAGVPKTGLSPLQSPLKVAALHPGRAGSPAHQHWASVASHPRAQQPFGGYGVNATEMPQQRIKCAEAVRFRIMESIAAS